ncbi:hypothetical protein P6P90_14055 [Ectobacillus antri]|jgi:hypothetical protein|uniref:Uncharacterized protein n=1 Tax=Ectobacillus antri TaxID=2486280 RepID=A0ABT6H6U9_9BACI|nr:MULTISPECIES: hypothetical protein [Ectobacillus]MDG4658040.1 hypothetical protein [Ectobacillus antri]MDG5755069.1 hypothetical protein [Ectobacillus antri]UOY91647.1 hypothetical protein MUG87_14260 [Ectobacillus sp. JY-23]
MATEQNGKKLSLKEVMMQQLAAKKQAQAQGKGSLKGSTATKGMKSQQTKKPNNQRRRMGV